MMICGHCKTESVFWRGPFNNLTFTECSRCGALNSQQIEEEEPEDEEPCPTCGNGDLPRGVTICPTCDAEWPDDELDPDILRDDRDERRRLEKESGG
jgi:hypothetical protein